MSDQAPLPSHTSKQSWWQQNWKNVIIAASLLVLFVGLLFGSIFWMMRSSGAYRMAMEIAQTDQRVVSRLGQPIKAGFLINGSINVSGASGRADLTVPLSGPKGEGALFVGADKEAGSWRFSYLIFVSQDELRIDLLQE